MISPDGPAIGVGTKVYWTRNGEEQECEMVNCYTHVYKPKKDVFRAYWMIKPTEEGGFAFAVSNTVFMSRFSLEPQTERKEE